MDFGLTMFVTGGLATGLLCSLAVGLVVGFFSGLLGIGGGALLVPVFKLGFAMEAIVSTATSLFTIIPTSISGFVTHLRRGTCIPKVGIAAGLAGAATSSLGVWLASHSPDWMIMMVAAVVIGYSAYTMLRKGFRMPKVANRKEARESANRKEAASKETSASVDQIPPAPQVTGKMLAQAVAIGLITGVVSGYVGVGGGFIMVPLFMSVLGTPMKLTSGTSLIAVMILAIPGVVYQGLLGNVDWLAGVAVAAGSIPGALLGARLIPYAPERALRILFGCFLLIAAALLLVNQLAPMA